MGYVYNLCFVTPKPLTYVRSGLWLRVKTYASTLGRCDKLFVEGAHQETNNPDSRYTVIHIEVSYCPLRAPGLPRLKALKSETSEPATDKRSELVTGEMGKEHVSWGSSAQKEKPKLQSFSDEKQGKLFLIYQVIWCRL